MTAPIQPIQPIPYHQSRGACTEQPQRQIICRQLRAARKPVKPLMFLPIWGLPPP